MNPRTLTWHILFFHHSVGIVFVLVLVHQSLVAASTFFLARVISDFQAGRAVEASLYLYLLTMALPYIPGSVCFVFVQQWINGAHQRFVRRMSSVMKDQVHLHRHAALRERAEAALARNGYPLIKEYIGLIHELTSLGLNSSLSMIVIAWLLPTQLLLGYFASLALCGLIVVSLRGLMDRAATEHEKTYIPLSGLLERCWDNLTLGNQHNQHLWQTQANRLGSRFYACATRLQYVRQAGNLLLAAASLGPTSFLVLAIAHDPAPSPSVLAALIVSLTRIFLLLNALSSLVHLLLELRATQMRLNVLFDTCQTMMPGKQTSTYGTISAIQVNGAFVDNTDQLAKMLAGVVSGRFTIRGANGSGKSSALLDLNVQHLHESLLLPANHGDILWLTDCSTLSSGQRTLAILDEILHVEGIHYLLLDEWDANIDPINMQRVDSLLDQISRKKVVIEVRHHGISAKSG